MAASYGGGGGISAVVVVVVIVLADRPAGKFCRAEDSRAPGACASDGTREDGFSRAAFSADDVDVDVDARESTED